MYEPLYNNNIDSDEDEEMTDCCDSQQHWDGIFGDGMGWEEQSQGCFEAVFLIRSRLFNVEGDHQKLESEVAAAAAASRGLLQEEGQQKSCIIR